MVTRLFLHHTTSGLPSGTLPNTEQSTLTPNDNFEGSLTTNRLMNETIGAGQQQLTNASISSTSQQIYYVTRWVSPKLKVSSIDANSWTLNFAASESDNRANFPISGNNQPLRINIYVWRTSTGQKVGTILDGNTDSVYSEPAGTDIRVKHGTFSGAAVNGITIDDDVIVFELWAVVTQQKAASYTQGVYYDGTTENTTPDTLVSNHAGFLETPQNILVEPDTTPPTVQSTIPTDNATGVRVTSGIAITFSEPMSPASINTTNITVENGAGTVSGSWVLSEGDTVATFIPSSNLANSTVYTVTVTTGVEDVALNNLASNHIFDFTVESEQVRSLISSSNTAQATTAGATEYWYLSNALLNKSSTEADRQIPYHTAGIISNLRVRVTGNSTTAPSTVRVRKNGANGNIIITIPAGSTGVFEDIIRSDSVAAGDKLCIQSISGGSGTLSFTIMSALFKSDTSGDALSKPNTHTFNITSSGTRYSNITGPSSTGGTENDHSSKLQKPCTVRNLWINVLSNPRTSDTTITIRKNNSSTSITKVIGAGVVGFLEDIVNSESFAVGDTISFQNISGAGTETLTLIIGCEIISSGSSYLGGGGSSTQTLNAGLSTFIAVGGITRDATEDNTKQKARLPFDISEMTMNVTANTITDNSTFTLRKNGVDTALSITYASGETGFKTDSVDTISFLETDDMSIGVNTGATGTSMTLRQIGLWNSINVLTRISKQITLVWNNNTRISKTSSISWNNFARISKQATILWHNSISISKLVSIVWNNSERISKLIDIRWNNTQQISKLTSLVWINHVIISKSNSIIWNNQTTISKIIDLRWNNFIRISKLVDLRWNNLARVSKAVSILWDNLTRISKQNSIVWNNNERLSKLTSLVWNNNERISKVISLLWDNDSRISKAITLQWHNIAQISKPVSLVWHNYNRIEKQVSLIWTNIARIKKTATIIWNNASGGNERLEKQITLIWDNTARISKSSDIRWNNYVSISKQVSLVWHNIARLSKATTLQWNNESRVSKAISLVWNNIQRISKVSNIQWNNKVTISKPVTIQWNNESRISKTVILIWINYQRISKQNTLIWNNFIAGVNRISKQITLVWNNQSRVSKTTTLRWNNLSRISKYVRLLWNNLAPEYRHKYPHLKGRNKSVRDYMRKSNMPNWSNWLYKTR